MVLRYDHARVNIISLQKCINYTLIIVLRYHNGICKIITYKMKSI